MKKLSKLILSSLFILLLACSGSKSGKEKVYEVKLAFSSTSDYCGGAPPNDRILKNLQAPKVYSSKDIMLSTENKLNDTMITLTLDKEGEVATALAARTYYVFLPQKLYTSFSKGGNEEACKSWKNTPNGTFDMEKGIKSLEVKFHITCDPCGTPVK